MNKINPEDLAPELREKWKNLQCLLKAKQAILVACSGGVDSSFLLYAATVALPEKVFAITINNVLMPKKETQLAFDTVKEMRTPWQSLQMDILSIPEISHNSIDRCYHCKKFLFTAVKELAVQKGIDTIAEGKNFDDQKFFRPGNRAAEELGLFQPLFEAKLTKQDIRDLAKAAGLSFWSRPAAPCLATRFPYNTDLTLEKLEQVENGEEILRKLGFEVFRLRHHGDLCRIEVPTSEIPELLAKSKSLLPALAELGFSHVCVDLNGYKSGSMDRDVEIQ